MTFKVSTGLRNHMLGTGSLKSALDGGKINIYGGLVPASGDDSVVALNSPLLCIVTNNSGATGITLDAAPANGVIVKTSTETWSGVNLASGVPTFYRHVSATDTNNSSITDKRVQGAIAQLGQEFDISSPSLVAGATQTVDYYSIQLPSA